MAINDPNAAALLQSLKEMIDENFIPKIGDKELKYQSRVASNLIALIQRELEFGDALHCKVQESLAALLDQQGSLSELNATLVRKIESGNYDRDYSRLMEHFSRAILAKIAIDNPNYPTFIRYQDSGELDIP